MSDRYGSSPPDGVIGGEVIIGGRYGAKLPDEATPIYVVLQAEQIQYSVVTSTPPTGKYKITNLYYDPEDNRIIIQYDNTPVQ